MKYLLIVLVVAVGYGVYSYGPDTMATYSRVRTQVEAAIRKTSSSAQSRAGSPEIPGQAEPSMLGQAATNLLPAAVDPFKSRVAASQRAAIQKYPTLSQANSEMNSRFVYRYKKLVTDKSPRLQDANWPLSLADECAAAVAESKVKTKSLPASSRKGTLAAAEATH